MTINFASSHLAYIYAFSLERHYNSFFRENLMHFCWRQQTRKSFSLKPNSQFVSLFLCVRARRKFWKLEGKLKAKAMPFQTHSRVLWKFSFMFAYSEKNFLLFFLAKWTSHLRSTKFSCILHASSSSSYRRRRRWNQIISNTFFYAAFHFLSQCHHLKCETLKWISPHDSCFCN